MPERYKYGASSESRRPSQSKKPAARNPSPLPASEKSLSPDLTPEQGPVRAISSTNIVGAVQAPPAHKLPQRAVYRHKSPEGLRDGAPCDESSETRVFFYDPSLITEAQRACEKVCQIAMICLTATVDEVRTSDVGMDALGGQLVRGGMNLEQIEKLAGLSSEAAIGPTE